MKKIGKLQINPEKLMKNEELLTLKGGYDGDECCGNICKSDSECTCTGCTKCVTIIGWPDQKACYTW